MSESALHFHMSDVSYIQHTSNTNYTWSAISCKGANIAKCWLIFLVTMSQVSYDNKSQLETQRFLFSFF